MIRNIIFDLGNVLVGVDFEKTRKLILSEGVSKASYNSFFNETNRKKFEAGKIKSREFIDNAYRTFGRKIPKTKLRLLFQDMFFEKPDMKKFLKKISGSGKFRIYLMSNTNPLHFNYIRKKFAYVNLVDRLILSYRLKLLKPGAGIYKAVLNKYELKPEETLFIDDLKANCETAEKFGIHAIHFKNYKNFVKQFNNFTAMP